MYRILINFHKRLLRGEQPNIYAVINTHLGYRAYSQRELSKVFSFGALLADGSITADGSHTAGSESAGMLEKSARVLSFESFERTLQPKKDDVLTAMSSKQLQHLSLELDNTDRYFSRLIAKEPFLSRSIGVYVGFDSDPRSEHLSIFNGTITELSVLPTMTVEADEQ